MILASLLISALGTLAVSAFTGWQVVKGSTQLCTNEQSKDVHKLVWGSIGFQEECFLQRYPRRSLTLPSSLDGHSIPLDVLEAKQSKGLVIMVHGLGGNRKTLYPTADGFLSLGYSVLLYDQRSSGENTAKKTTFGVWEQHDLIDCLRYAKEVLGETRVGVWGESFGGATALLAASRKEVQKELSFLILDCPLGSMKQLLRQHMKKMHIPLPMPYLMFCGNVMNRLLLGFSYKDAEGIRAAEQIHLPCLVIGTKADRILPPAMAQEVFDAIPTGNKALWMAEGSAHVAIWDDHNDEYRRKIQCLIDGDPI